MPRETELTDFVGYLSGISGGMSGLATVTVREALPADSEKHHVFVESGFGLRQLDDALNFSGDRRRACTTECLWIVDDLGCLVSVEPL